jgi:uncharacterized protein YutE (UPF0331/DUF86 family)
MTKQILEKDIILVRTNGILGELKELYQISHEPFDQFSSGSGYKLAQYHLHRTLEGIFHISSYILSRFPGGQSMEYSSMARKMGEVGIVDQQFADEVLVKMAKYRNRLVHFYAQITPEELYNLLQHNLSDIERFLKYVETLLQDPELFGLQVE